MPEPAVYIPKPEVQKPNAERRNDFSELLEECGRILAATLGLGLEVYKTVEAANRQRNKGGGR
jgi:hypothetical protein